MNRTTKTAWKIVLATLLTTSSGFNFVSPVAAKTTQTAQADLPLAVETKVPALVRAQLPRRATTVFYVKARLENRDVLLHAWNTAKGDTTLDILVWAPNVRQNRHRGARPVMTLQRINRVGIGRVAIISDNYSVRTAPLNARTGRGAVISLKYYEEQVAVAYTTLPMLVVTLPNGLSGQAITQDFSTEGQSEGGTYFEPRIGANGQVFLVKVDYSPINKMQTETRFLWSGRKYVSEGRSVEVPMPPE